VASAKRWKKGAVASLSICLTVNNSLAKHYNAGDGNIPTGRNGAALAWSSGTRGLIGGGGEKLRASDMSGLGVKTRVRSRNTRVGSTPLGMSGKRVAI